MRFILFALGMSCCAPFQNATRVGPGVYVEADVSNAPEGRAVYAAVVLMMVNWPGEEPEISDLDPILISFTDHSSMPQHPTLYVVGYTDDRQHVYVQIDDKRDKASNSSLTHELTHLFLWRLYDDPDHDHEEEVVSKVWTKEHTMAGIKTDLQLLEMGW